MKNYNSPKLEVSIIDIDDVILESSQEMVKNDGAFGFDITERV